MDQLAVANHSKDNLKGFTRELDHEVGSIGLSVATLVDVENLLGNLVESMNEAAYKGEQMAYFNEHHTKIRVYWNLIRHTVNELSAEYEKVEKIKDGLFNEVVKRSNEKRQ
ncbi:hypothetical protein ACIQHV_19030 [Bacillus bombysepticus]|uniref:Uncharacterized protein n=1 Tax=Bacillus thuringiensis serovar kumamotoensis TaxID=132267 RepID=A0A9X6JNU6_BACUK|nr:hypothetical protein [Bacillus thuringiensis]MEC2868902.1 hypothetical protein [Bacillus cereus]OTZ69279.1 hypothetical protein BK769_23150 [Bacillus thuringiensis serovar kumamtoensis]